MFKRLLRNKYKLTILVIILVVVAYSIFHTSVLNAAKTYTTSSTTNDDSRNYLQVGKTKTENQKVLESHKFWNQIFNSIDRHNINLKKYPENPIQYTDSALQSKGIETKEVLQSRAHIDNSFVKEVQSQHQKFVSELPLKLAEATYKKNSKGVVLIGGGRFTWLSYLALVAIRETKSELPVEIIMPSKEDYESEIELCEKVLPLMSASCLVVSDALGEEVTKNRKFESYQFKSLALAITSFQHVLLLDSDNIIVSNPDPIFDSELYNKYQMITWPDYWRRKTSPVYYDIANMKVNEQKRVRYDRFPLKLSPQIKNNLVGDDVENTPFHDLEGAIPDLSTESGQLMIDKESHGRTILLALYYNIYGPNLFYKLFAMGDQGEGDKDTFVAAAELFQESYYQLKSFILTFGYFDHSNNFQGVAMGQKNPLIDYKLYQDIIVESFLKKTPPETSIPNQIEELKKLRNEHFDSRNSNPLFTIHCNFPKLDPLNYMANEEIYDSKEKIMKFRLYNGLKYNKHIGSLEEVEVDFEFERWLQIQDALCVRKISFNHFKGSNIANLCEFIDNQVRWLRSHPSSD